MLFRSDSPGMRQLKQWSRIMDEKSKFISDQTYTEKTWQMLEEMLKSNTGLFKEYERINNTILSEKLKGDTLVGKSEESLLEKGTI